MLIAYQKLSIPWKDILYQDGSSWMPKSLRQSIMSLLCLVIIHIFSFQLDLLSVHLKTVKVFWLIFHLHLCQCWAFKTEEHRGTSLPPLLASFLDFPFPVDFTHMHQAHTPSVCLQNSLLVKALLYLEEETSVHLWKNVEIIPLCIHPQETIF